jgi:Ca2+-binding EF-hand superfamily protein
MGSDSSKMGIVAMAIVSGIEREHILKLQSLFHQYSTANSSATGSGGGTTAASPADQQHLSSSNLKSSTTNLITRQDFDQAIKILQETIPPGLEQSDYELLDRLFILLDESGDCQINYKDYLIGITILITGTFTEKLLFAFSIFDEMNSGTLMLSEMKQIFLILNQVTSFFGDPVLNNVQIKELVIDIFKAYQNPSQIAYAECLETIISHPIVGQFINGKGTVRFGR